MPLPVRVSLVLGSEHRQQKAEEDGYTAKTHQRHYWNKDTPALNICLFFVWNVQ